MMRNFIAMQKDYINLWEDCEECDTMEDKVVHLATKINRLSEPKEYLTSKEAANYLGIKVSTLNDYCWSGLIPYSKPTDRKRYFKRSDLNGFMSKNRHRSRY